MKAERRRTLRATTIERVIRKSQRKATGRFLFLALLFIVPLLFSASLFGAEIPQGGWTLKYVDSEELVGQNGAAVNAFDGNTGTIWHTQWSGSNPPPPHEIQIDLGMTYNINGFYYLPRQDGGVNGRIKQYEFYVSADGVNWGTPVSTGTFANDATRKQVSFTSKAGRFVRLRALSEVNGNPWTSMAELSVLGTPSWPPHAVTRWRGNKAGAVTLTLDDGYVSEYTLGIPALESRGFRGTFFVITGLVQTPAQRYCSWDNWRDAASRGHEIGSHTKTHPDLTTLTHDQMVDEVAGSKTVIDGQITSQKCTTFAYPYGEMNSDVQATALDSYIAARGVTCVLNQEPYDFSNIKACDDSVTLDQMEALTDSAVSQSEWLVPIFHALDGGTDYGNWQVATLTLYLDYLNTKNVWVDTFGAVVKYIKERASANLSVLSSSSQQIVLSLTDTLDDATYDEPLTIRSEIPANWTSVTIQQGTYSAPLTPVAEGSATVVYYDAIPDDGNITLSSGTASNPAPTIGSISPTSAIAGGTAFTLTVTGTNFISGSAVRWNGANRTTTYGSPTQLTAAITAADIATAGTASVTVFNPTPGGGTSNALTFTITASNPVPTATSLNPSSAIAGGTAFTLTVTGTNFISGSAVRWNGANRTTTYGSPTQLTAAITAADIATAGTASVTVFNPTPGGGTSNALTFTITASNPVPTATSLNPSSAIAGGTAFTLTVTGTNFISGSAVRWNGANRTTTYGSPTQLTAAITAADIATAGTASVTVFNPTPGGGTSNALTFTITASNPVPTATSLNPSSAIAGGTAFTLTVTGTNFISGSAVRWNGANRTTTYGSPTQLTAAITAADIATAGTASVTVFNPTPGGGTSNALTFTITASNPVPTATSLNPSSAIAGGTAFTLTVTGTNFISGSAVRWNGANRTTTYGSPTQLTAAITAADIATAGTASVTVFNPTPGGGTSNALTFTITASNPVPTATSLNPSSAIAGGTAFTLTVTGTNFISGSAVRWNGANRTTTYGSPTQLTAAITAADIATAGTASVTVFNPTPGGGTSNALTFTITASNPVPTATSLNPSSAIAGGTAFTLTVTGTNFISGSAVRWNGANRTTTYGSPTQLTAAITAADIATAGTASVTVFNPTPGGGTSNALTFTITAVSSLPAPTLVWPAWTITTTTPAYKWNAVPTATAYTLRVDDSTGTRIQQSYSAADAGCAAGTGTCTVTPPVALNPGAGTWWVQASNATGTGPWSAGLSFTLAAGGPGPATLIAPSGTLTTKTPTYSWNAVSAATWYILWVDDSTGPRIRQWYPSANVGCGAGTGTCAITPSTALNSGAGRWWIQTWNSTGDTLSSPLSFTVP